LALSAAKVGRIERNRYLMLGKHLSLRAVVALSPVLVATEILTWGYAGLRGRACLAAKARATAWAVVHLWPVVRTPWRPVEGRILRQHQPAPPVVAGAGGPPSRLVQSALRALSRGAAVVSLALLPSARAVETRPLAATPADREGRGPVLAAVRGRGDEGSR
jgi:hypothetical protein